MRKTSNEYLIHTNEQSKTYCCEKYKTCFKILCPVVMSGLSLIFGAYLGYHLKSEDCPDDSSVSII